MQSRPSLSYVVSVSAQLCRAPHSVVRVRPAPPQNQALTAILPAVPPSPGTTTQLKFRLKGASRRQTALCVRGVARCFPVDKQERLG